MGNRCNITFMNDPSGVGIYLHWNGGVDSVTAFCEYCKLRNFRTGSYGLARMAQVIGNYFRGGLSIGITRMGPFADSEENGLYSIDDDWSFIHYKDGFRISEEAERHEGYDINEMLCDIDESQPESERLGQGFILADETDRNDLKVGDKVYVLGFDEKYSVEEIVGLGEDKFVNGVNVKGIPYTNEYGPDNINSYLRAESYRVAK